MVGVALAPPRMRQGARARMTRTLVRSSLLSGCFDILRRMREGQAAEGLMTQTVHGLVVLKQGHPRSW